MINGQRWEGATFRWNGLFFEAHSSRWRAKVWPAGRDIFDVVLIRPGGNRGVKGCRDALEGLARAKSYWIADNEGETW